MKHLTNLVTTTMVALTLFGAAPAISQAAHPSTTVQAAHVNKRLLQAKKAGSMMNHSPNTRHLSGRESQGYVIVPHTVKAEDSKSDDRQAIIPKGTKLHFKKVSNGIMVWNNKIRSSDSPNSRHEYIVVPGQDQYVTKGVPVNIQSNEPQSKINKNNKNKAVAQKKRLTKPNAATKDRRNTAAFPGSRTNNAKRRTRKDLPQASDSYSKSVIWLIVVVCACLITLLVPGDGKRKHNN